MHVKVNQCVYLHAIVFRSLSVVLAPCLALYGLSVGTVCSLTAMASPTPTCSSLCYLPKKMKTCL
jgi:hypothetical protein